MEQHNFDIRLLERYLAGTASPEEVQQVEDWLAASEANAPLFDDEHSTEAIRFKDKAKAALLGKMNADPDAAGAFPRRRITMMRWAAAAAMAGILITAWVFHARHITPTDKRKAISLKETMSSGAGHKALLHLSGGRDIALDTVPVNAVITDGNVRITKTNGHEIEYAAGGNITATHTLSLPKASRYTVVLPDGSKVWLNALSAITFPAAFTSAARQVSIRGEAYFEVAKRTFAGARQPFVVQAGAATIQVLGTHFNINAYENEPVIKTTLLEGSVQVNVKGKHTLIQPGQQARATRHGNLSVVQPDIDEVMAWKKGYLQFDNTPLEEVFRQIARWYDVEVRFAGNAHQGAFHGKIYPNMQLSEILSGLKANGARFSTKGNIIIVE
ncbi:FecR family protein [Chitinophaga vietnamensis]|uniref:FecR family protein n=1 Tax=Chitinophaga vietnamensis TaxID=2593957 RepID=UPI001178C9E2|nr:FecR family protein [Chitinophaga vietnamensis]